MYQLRGANVNSESESVTRNSDSLTMMIDLTHLTAPHHDWFCTKNRFNKPNK